MDKKIAGLIKALVTMAAVAAISYGGLLLWLLTLLTKRPFVSWFVVAAWLAAVAFLFCWCYRNRMGILATVVLFVLCAGVVGGVFARDAYVASIPVVSDGDVDLREYMPFKAGTRAAVLKKPASLRLGPDAPRLDGATALYPLYAAFANAVYPEGDYNPRDSAVQCTTTPTAYENLLNGRVELIFCARPSAKQAEAAQAMGKTFNKTAIGKEAFVFFVNRRNPVDGLSSKDIVSIYSGESVNWKTFGGRPEAIKVFQRPEGSGSQTMLQKIMDGETLIEPLKEDVIAGMGGIIERTANYRNFRNALGYSFLFYSTQMVKNGDIKLLAIDGVAPSKETIRDGSYPYSSEFYAITLGNESAATRSFVEWILSDEGQYLVEATGYVPLE